MTLTRPALVGALALASATFAAPAPARADDRPLFGERGAIDRSIPTWQETLGFTPGSRPVRYDEIVRYFEALAKASPRAELETYGATHEGRPLVHLVVSSPTNMRTLPAIREAVRVIGDPRDSTPDADVERLIESTPSIAWLGYSIHGDEVSSSDAALLVAHQLVAGTGAATRKLLDELVIIIDPVQNPDGRERILSMTWAFRGKVQNADPDALSHTGFWPYGRGNHYLFDLNRDWFTLVHPESRAKARVFSKWRPQLIVDSHEMGASDTYLFNPPRGPYNPFLPEATLEQWRTFGKDQAAAFDRHGWSYYTREWNEEFFPGYGSSIAMYRGALGILYEQASTDGSDVRLPSGKIRTYKESVVHHFVSSLTNLTSLADRRAGMLRDFRTARGPVGGMVSAFYVEPEPDRGRAARFIQTLLDLGIEVDVAVEAHEVGARTDVRTGAAIDRPVPSGTCRIRVDQPLGRLIRVILDPHVPMPTGFLAEERWYQERGKGTRLYEATSWSALLANDVRASWRGGELTGAHFEPLKEVGFPKRAPVGDARYGWLIDGKPDEALRAAAALLEAGLIVRCGLEPVAIGEHAFGRGALLVRREDNDDDADATIAEIAQRFSVRVVGVPTALATEGPDLGGQRFRLLEAPKVAIAVGPQASTTEAGAAWRELDAGLGVRTSLIEARRLAGALDRYNVVILTGSWGGSWSDVLGESGLKKLVSWVEGGGTLIALGGGAQFAASEKSGLSAVRLRSDVLEKFPAPRFGLPDDDIRKIERFTATGLSADGKAPAQARATDLTAATWPEALRIPGIGEPVLGAGAIPFAGDAGARALERGAAWRESARGEDGAEEKPTDDEKKAADGRLRRLNPRGAILRVELDVEEWLAFGAGEETTAMVRGSRTLIAPAGVRTVGRYPGPDRLHLGGLLWPEAAGRWAMTAFVTRESKGRGQVILFAEDPNFRGYFRGTARLFGNAVVLGPGMGASRTIPWRRERRERERD